MEYQNLNAEEREAITERLDLVTERIHELAAEPEVCEPFRAYFKGTAAFIVKTEEVLRQVLNDSFCSQNRETLQKINEALYEDILPEHYKESYANPDYACITLGEEYGTLLSMLYAELRSLIPYAYEGDVEAYTCFCELFIQVYTCFNDEEGTTPKEVQQAIYWFFHDYSELFTERSVCEMVDASRDFFTRIVMDSDLQDLKYLYYYGEPIGENEIRMAEYMNQLPQEKIQAMADTYTEGYRIGFITTGKDLSIKSTVNVDSPSVGQMFKALLQNDQAMTVVITIVLINCSLYITSNLLIYFFKYDFGGDAWYNSYTLFNTFGGGIQIISMMIFFPLLRKFLSVLKVFYVSFVMAIAGYGVLFILTLTNMSNLLLLFIPSFFIFTAFGMLTVLTTVFLANTVDYGELKNNRRDESVIFSMQTFVVKLASGVAALAASICLNLCHLSNDTAETATAAASGSSLLGLRMTMAGIPIIGLLIAVLVFRKKFILTEEKVQEITEQIKGKENYR